MKKLICGVWAMSATVTMVSATSTLTIDTKEAKAKVSPIHYGVMTEEINYCYDGGLYAELVRNRVFKDDAEISVNWSVEGAGNMIKLDTSAPLN